jgi:hypothetical protein
LVQWPGHEDSEGDASALTFDRMVEVALDALASGRKRFPEITWSLGGIRLGGAVVALAAAGAAAPTSLLVQPVLDPVGYFHEVERAARRNRLLGDPHNPHPGWSVDEFEIPEGLRAPRVSTQVSRALAALSAGTGVVRYATPSPGPLPPHVVDVVIEGAWWWPPGGDHRILRDKALRFLGSRR